MPHSQSPSDHGQLEYEAAVHVEALERITELEQCALECEQRAANPTLDAIDAEALLDAAAEYRRRRGELLCAFYPLSTLLLEEPERRRRANWFILLYCALAIGGLAYLVWRHL